MTHRGPPNWAERDPAGLSYQERRVLEFLRKGKTTREIAGYLGLTYDSARVYVYRALRKTGTHNRLELVATVPHWSPGAALDDEIDAVASRGNS
jgi:DNA-binding CsgD family transcriptional regulator